VLRKGRSSTRKKWEKNYYPPPRGARTKENKKGGEIKQRSMVYEKEKDLPSERGGEVSKRRKK